jgi:hypothetical protein
LLGEGGVNAVNAAVTRGVNIEAHALPTNVAEPRAREYDPGVVDPVTVRVPVELLFAGSESVTAPVAVAVLV